MYTHLIDKMLGKGNSFLSWLGLVTWTSLPGLLSVLVIMVGMLTSDGGQVALEELNTVTLNGLLLHLPMDHTWFAIANSINPFSIWGLVLMVLGFKSWTNRSTPAAALWTLTPYLLLYGAWAGFIFAFK